MKTSLVIRSLQAIGLFSTLTSLASAVVPDASFYMIAKIKRHMQTSPGTPVPGDYFNTTNPDNFGFFSGLLATADTAITAVSFAKPGGAPTALVRDGTWWSTPGGSAYNATTQAALDAMFPNGSYTMRITPVHDNGGSQITATLTLSGDVYPQAPAIANWTTLQHATASTPITIVWNQWTAGTAADAIHAEVFTDDGSNRTVLWQSPYPGMPGSIDGTATHLVIPAASLAAKTQYFCEISFCKQTSSNTSSYPGVPGYALQMSSTVFPLNTGAAAIATRGLVMGHATDGTTHLMAVEDHRTPGPTPDSWHIGAQLLSRDGLKIGGLIDTGRTGIGGTVAFDGTNYLMIWEDDELGTLNGLTGWKLYGQFISPAGVRVGVPFAITTAGIWFDGVKPLAFGGGRYLATYTRLINPALGDHSENRMIAGRIVYPDGSMGSEFRISTGNGQTSEAASDGSSFFVAWCEDQYDTEIRGRLVSAAGVPGTEISVNASPEPSDNPVYVIFNGTNYLVTWSDEVNLLSEDWDSFGQFISPAGAKVGGVITIASTPYPEMLTGVAFDGVNHLAVWTSFSSQSEGDLYGRYFASNGQMTGGVITISNYSGIELGGVGFANGRYLAVVNRGVVFDPNGSGIDDVSSADGVFLWPPVSPVSPAESAAPRFGLAGGNVNITVLATTPGHKYQLQASESMLTNTWLNQGAAVTGDGNTLILSTPHTPAVAKRFFRVRVGQ